MYPKSQKLLQAFFFVWVLLVDCHCQQLVSSRRDTNGSISCIERESRALLKLKQSLVDEHGVLSSWGGKEGELDCCKWWGVECNNQTRHIEKPDLRARDQDQPLRGEISASLTDLQHLTFLDFSWNDFGGNPIPEFIGSLTNSRYLDPSHASFSGKIPYRLRKLSSLTFLDLFRNYLVGEIPYQLGNLSNLQFLGLGRNHLSGIIPYQIGNLSKLEELYLGPNDDLQVDHSPTNSEWISHLSSIRVPTLDNFSNLKNLKNWLQIIGQQSNLEVLSPQNYSLSNMDLLLVPPSQLNFSNSLELGLSQNKFTSSIFLWLFHLNCSLTVLDLGENLLEGPVPDDLGRIMNSLQFLYFRNNQLNGTMPKTIANLSKLTEFDVAGNSLKGEITNLVHCANLTKLKLLDLSQNSITLNFSNDWIPQFQLESFSVQSCKLGPGFPKWRQTLKDLSYLDVSNARISDMAMVASFLCTTSASFNFLNMSNNHLTGHQLGNVGCGTK